ncbi:serine proteinase stubble isoform X2 [Anopheles funestus]|uniref:serine proteinase stubble isoform X2 n=1 Tax=Anopheles funestus TaxID=62324 RepID=UPI0020C60C70|nr:serine proteinase stubble isoform X2 [Anopheles funestus]
MSSVDLRRGTVRWGRHRSAVQFATRLALLFASVLSSAYSSPVFPFTSFQASRNLRHLPCVVRNTGEEGICMFAIDCFKSNGTHLGVCIDKIFFGSCCQVNDDRLLFDPDITDNSIDHNSVGNFQHFPQSSVMNTHRKPPLTETRLPTTPASNGTKYELLSTSTTTRRTTAKNNRRTTSTVRTTKAPLKVQQKDDLQTTTEYQEFTTFQYVQSSKNPSGTQSIAASNGAVNKRPSPARPSVPSLVTQDNRTSTTRATTPKPYKNRRPTTNKTTTIRPPNRRPSQPLTTSTETPTTTPPLTTRKVSGQNTRQPTTSTTIGFRKPPSTIAAAQTQTTIGSRRPTTTQSSPKTESTTPSVTYSRRPTTSPSLVPLTKPTSNRRRPTTSTTPSTTTTVTAAPSTDTTRAPRPRPKPTSQVATVPATSLDHLIETHSSSSESSASAVVSTSPTKLTYPTTTVKVTHPTTPTPTPTPTPASSTKRTTQSEPSVQSSTVKVPGSSLELGDGGDLATLSRPGLVTWTSILEDAPTERPSVNQGASSTTDGWSSSKRPIDTTSTTEAMLVRETTTAVEESIESATEGSGEEESGSGSEEGSSEEEEEEEGEVTDESEETIDATTTSIENVTDSLHKVTNESSTLMTSTPASISSSQSTTVSSTSATLETNTMAASTLSPVSISSGVTSPSSAPSTLSTTSSNTSTASPLPPVTSDRGPTTEGTTTGMPIKFPEQSVGNQSALPTTTTLAMLANVTTDGVTLAPDFLTTSTLPTLEGIDYRSVCGKRMFPEPRIVGGTKAAFGRWPWQISLRQWRTSTYLHKCGAALLNENWAITAAHCVDNVPPSDLLLRLGEYDLALEEEPYGYQERRVQIVASHPQFDPRTFEYDLALLRFYEPVIFQPNIIPVCVPENDENFIGRTAFVTGWGRLYEDGPLPSVLQEVTVPVIENKICETMYRSAGYIEHIPHIFICAGWKKGGYDSCEGDSGGPMVIQRPDKRFLLAGVISWGIGCAEPNQPGVYTRISEFRDWINQILQF